MLEPERAIFLRLRRGRLGGYGHGRIDTRDEAEPRPARIIVRMILIGQPLDPIEVR
jgi:hypothetical protein